MGVLAGLLTVGQPFAQAKSPDAAAAAAALAALPQPTDITALNAVVFDPVGERILWGRNPAQGVPMASTTKIMTTLLALEAGTLDDTVVVSRRAAQMGGAGLGLKVDQRIAMRSLLAGLMLRSGNDAALAVAEHVAGSEEAFVARMNARAAELALEDTVFLSASGLTEDRTHRASPLALARLTKVAMAHPDFAKWSGARQLAVPGLGLLQSRNELLGRYPGADGVKTGFLASAGLALVASATRDDLPLYVVVLGSRDNFGDARKLLDWGYTHFRLARPAGPGTVIGPYRWPDDQVDLVTTNGLAAAVRRDATVAWQLRLHPARQRPVSAGTELGVAELTEDGAVITRAALTTVDEVVAPRPAPGTTTPDRGAAVGQALQDALRAFSRLTAVTGAA